MDFIQLDQSAQLPTRQTQDAAGYDLHTIESAVVGGVRVVRTGVAVRIPPGHVGLVRDRSGHAANRGITVLAGVIDADYRGEIKVVLSCTTGANSVAAGERVAQLIVVPCVMEDSQWVDAFDETARSGGGFGSTGEA